MKRGQHRFQAARVLVFRRMTDKVVVIRKHRPRLESPAKFLGHREKATFQNIEPDALAKMVGFFVSTRRYDKGPAFRELMRWGMRPGDVRHGEIYARNLARRQDVRTCLSYELTRRRPWSASGWPALSREGSVCKRSLKSLAHSSAPS